MELHIPAVLMDDWQGRQAAELRGILAVGTLNILDAADRRGLLNFEQAVDRLRQTNFHIAPAILESFLADVRARKSGSAE